MEENWSMWNSRKCQIGAILFSTACLLSIAATPARADVILAVDMSNLMFQAAAGNNSCAGLPCRETFNITFDWDNTTETAVPGTFNVSATGALTPGDVAGPWSIGNYGGYPNGIGVIINEFPPGPDYITISDTDFVTPLAPGTYPGSDAFMGCYESPSQCDTKFDYHSPSGLVYPPGNAISGTVTVSVLIVPEAGSWSLFLIGLAPLALWHRRLCYKVKYLGVT
jgi:hypothetical protein